MAAEGFEPELDCSPALASRIAALGPYILDRPVKCRELAAADLASLERAHEDGPMLLLLGEAPSPYLMRVLQAKVAGAVLVDADFDRTFPAAVAALGAGLRVLPELFRAELDRPALSAREKQMLAMVVLDMSNGEIAARLHVSESNVKFHLSSAFAKLGVRSRAAAAAIVVDPDAGLGVGILRITTKADDQL